MIDIIHPIRFIHIITMGKTSNSSLKWTSRGIGLVWAFLSACFAIINIFVFIQPQWIGDTLSSPRAGHFGLYSYCISETDDYDLDCHGQWMNFHAILNLPWAVSTFLVGFSLILIHICLATFLLFFCFRTRLVYFICGSLQTGCAISLLLALIIYPAGFDHDTLRSVCGFEAHSYNLDTCQFRWAFILAMVGFFNVTVLALLAFILGMKHPRSMMMKEVINPIHALSKYGHLNDTLDERTLTESSKSMSITERH